MFIVASDLHEWERETHNFSLQNTNTNAYTVDAVQTLYVELFCTPKSSMKNPSLRVSGHGGSTKRTFIVENFAEVENGQWTTDGATGEQGYIDDERSCFSTWDDNEQSV